MRRPLNSLIKQSVTPLGIVLSCVVPLLLFRQNTISHGDPSVPLSLLSIIFIFSSLTAIGHFSLKPFKLSSHSNIWHFIFCFALGMGELGLLILILGWAFPGSLHVKLNFIFIFISLLLPFAIFFIGKKWPSFNYKEKSFSIIELSSLSLTAITMGLALLTCFSPITYYDSLVYHLGLPNLYLIQDQISTITFNLYSFFPANTEMIFLFILNSFPSSEYTINMITWVITALIGMGIFKWGQELTSVKWGVIGMMLWWSLPCVLLLSVGAYIDIPLAFYVFLSIKSFMIYEQNPKKMGWLVLSGLFSGIACATKYTGVITPFILGIFLLKNQKFKPFFIFSMAAMLPFLPWLIKNLIEIGNPVFPFFYQVLGSHSGWSENSAESYFKLLTQYGDKSRFFSDLIDLFFRPWNIIARFGGGFDVLGNFGWWPVILWSPILLFFTSKKNKNIQLLLVYSIIHFSIWFLSKPVLRFLIAWLPIGCLLSTFLIHYLFTQKKQSLKWVSGLILTPWLLSNVFFFLFISNELNAFSVPTGRDTHQDFLSRRLSFYDTFTYANLNLQPTDKIYVMGEQRGYHLKIPYIASNYFAQSPLSLAANNSSGEEGIYQFLKNHQITHIIVNENEIKRLGGLKKFGFDTKGSENLSLFLAQKKTLFRHQNVTLLVAF